MHAIIPREMTPKIAQHTFMNMDMGLDPFPGIFLCLTSATATFGGKGSADQESYLGKIQVAGVCHHLIKLHIHITRHTPVVRSSDMESGKISWKISWKTRFPVLFPEPAFLYFWKQLPFIAIGVCTAVVYCGAIVLQISMKLSVSTAVLTTGT